MKKRRGTNKTPPDQGASEHNSSAGELPATRSNRAPSAPSSVDLVGANSELPPPPPPPPPKDWKARLVLGWAMVIAINLYMYFLRQPGIVALVFTIQAVIFYELVRIGSLGHAEERHLPGFRRFYAFWFAVAVFFMYAKTLQVPLLSSLTSMTASSLLQEGSPMVDPLDPGALTKAIASAAVATTNGGGLPSAYEELVRAAVPGLAAVVARAERGAVWLAVRVIAYHAPIAFGLYTLGFVAFVLSLRKHRQFRYQFAQFAYCHVALLVVVGQSTMIISNVYQGGMVWFLLPCGLVVTNDTLAYFFGRAFGRTPLIRLSPKKTWEGFVGGGLSTLLFGVVAPAVAQRLTWGGVDRLMLCPVSEGLGLRTLQSCDISAVAEGLYAMHPLASWLPPMAAAALPAVVASIGISRMQLHAVSLALFASVVAPFGGFFASGFKRAFKIKDFGDSIPGHGGFTDRFDCQIVMGAFSYVYARYVLHLGAGYVGGHADVLAMYSRVAGSVAPADLSLLFSMLGCHLLQLRAADPGIGLPAAAADGGGATAAAALLRAGDPGLLAYLPPDACSRATAGGTTAAAAAAAAMP